MPQLPDAPKRTHSLPDPYLNSELDKIFKALSATIQFLQIPLNPDGSLKDHKVGKNTLTPDALSHVIQTITQKSQEILDRTTNSEKNTQHFLTKTQEILKSVETLDEEA